jgi:hypothetical protein
LDEEGIPHEFETTSRVLIIVNDWNPMGENMRALQDRGHLISFEPSALEVHQRTSKWFWDQEVFDFIGEHLHVIGSLSMRLYTCAAETKAGGLDWKKMLLSQWLDGRRLLVAKLKASNAFNSEVDRVRAFRAEGGGCRATYFNIARRLAPAVVAPSIRLSKSLPSNLGSIPNVVPIAAPTVQASGTANVPDLEHTASAGTEPIAGSAVQSVGQAGGGEQPEIGGGLRSRVLDQWRSTTRRHARTVVEPSTTQVNPPNDPSLVLRLGDLSDAAIQPRGTGSFPDAGLGSDAGAPTAATV